MDDFRNQLAAVVDAMRAAGTLPAFLIIDLEGAGELKRIHGVESLDKFRDATVNAVSAAAGGCDTFTYGDARIVVILDAGFDRLKTFALIDRLRRALPFLSQSFDCLLTPEFDVIEYDEEQGVAGIITHIVRPRERPHGEDVA
ncbi:MAG: hypothetical protein WEC75_09505 [Dehalococcoidia bacterium]